MRDLTVASPSLPLRVLYYVGPSSPQRFSLPSSLARGGRSTLACRWRMPAGSSQRSSTYFWS